MFFKKLSPEAKQVEKIIEKNVNIDPVDWETVKTAIPLISESDQASKTALKILLKKMTSHKLQVCRHAIEILDLLFKDGGLFFRNAFISEESKSFFDKVPEFDGILEFENRKYVMITIKKWMKISDTQATKEGLKSILKKMLANEINVDTAITALTGTSKKTCADRATFIQKEIPGILNVVSMLKESLEYKDADFNDFDLQMDFFIQELVTKIKSVKKWVQTALQVESDEKTTAELISLNDIIHETLDDYKRKTSQKTSSKSKEREKSRERLKIDGKDHETSNESLRGSPYLPEKTNSNKKDKDKQKSKGKLDQSVSTLADGKTDK